MRGRYSIQVGEEIVEIFGDLTIEEAFDFLSFFERKGYKSVVIGSENSTLRMMKIDQDEEIVNERISQLIEEVSDYENYLKCEKESHKNTLDKLRYTETLMKSFMNEESKKKLHVEIEKFLDKKRRGSIEDSKIINDASGHTVCGMLDGESPFKKE